MSSDCRPRDVLIGSGTCLTIVLEATRAPVVEQRASSVFHSFVHRNSVCYWNECLVRSVSNLELVGWLAKPFTLIVSGSDLSLAVTRSAWARRVLRPPSGYLISALGDMAQVDMRSIPQTQFAPLSEALCKVVVELNSDNVTATATTVALRLAENFPEMEVPNEGILYKTLGALIKERKLYHTGQGYFVVRPDTYRQRSLSPLHERQMLMTNEEAIVRLHGDQESPFSPSPEYQQILSQHTLLEDQSHRPTKTEATHIHSYEKQSMFTKIFRRMQSFAEKPNKQVTFSAQFPSSEWLEQLNCHSVATQTSFQMRQSHEKKSLYVESSPLKMPWYQADDKSKVKPNSLRSTRTDVWDNKKSATEFVNQTGNNSPSHRCSYGAYVNHYKRHYRDRKSSNASPKIDKSRKDRTTNESISCVNSNPKAIISPCSYANKSQAVSWQTGKTPSQNKASKIYANLPVLINKVTGTPKQINASPTIPGIISKSKVSDPCSSENDNVDSNTNSYSELIPKCVGLVSEVNKFYNNRKNYSTNVDNNHLTHMPEDCTLDSAPTEAQCDKNNLSNTAVPCSESAISEIVTVRNSLEPSSTNKEQKASWKEYEKEEKTSSTTKERSPTKEIIIDNSVNVEVAVEKLPKSKSSTVSQTTVTEETTVTHNAGNAKVVTITSIRTNLSRGSSKDSEEECRNSDDVHSEKSPSLVDYSCNIRDEIK